MSGSTHLAVVGTGTGVGKTVLTAGLVGWLRQEGIDARAVKPVQTGFPPDDDAGFVAAVCGTNRAATCLRSLEAPLAPAIAAREEGTSLSYGDLRADCERALVESEVGILEGIGGLRVPLTADREVVDLVAHLDLSTLVVARSGLGTLNHTALTVAALERRGVAVRGAVLNEFEGETVAERTNPAALEGMIDVPIHTLPPGDLADPPAATGLVREHLPASVLGTALDR